jgi:hypothetical protein
MKSLFMRIGLSILGCALIIGWNACASNPKLSEDDRWLWEANTNAPATMPPK